MMVFDDIQGGGVLGGRALPLIRRTDLYDYRNRRPHMGRVDQAADAAAEAGCPLILNLESVYFPLVLERAVERMGKTPTVDGPASRVRDHAVADLKAIVTRIRDRQPDVGLMLWSDNAPPLYSGKCWVGPNHRLLGKSDAADVYRAQCDELMSLGVPQLFDWACVTAYTYHTDDGTVDPRRGAWAAMIDFFIESVLRWGKPVNVWFALDYRGDVFDFKPRRDRSAELGGTPIEPDYLRRQLEYLSSAWTRGLIDSATCWMRHRDDVTRYDEQIEIVRSYA